MELSYSSIIPIIHLHVIIITLSFPKLITSQSTFVTQWCSDTTYPPNSTYQTNLKKLLNSLSTDTRITYGFYNFSLGHQPDRVNSLALCRGDVPVNTCRLCIQNAANLLPQVCPNQKEAFGYSGYCSIFISNRSIYGQIQDDGKWFIKDNSDSIKNGNDFNNTLSSLMRLLQNRAASGDSERKFASGEAKFGGGQSLYGLVQCTPDLSRRNCMQCIDDYLQNILPNCCVQRNYKASGAIFVQPSCFVRYNVDLFFGNVPDLALSPPPPPPGLLPRPPNNSSSISTAVHKRKKDAKLVAICIPIAASTILVMSIIFIILSWRKRPRKTWMLKFSKDEIKNLQSLQFSLRSIKHATNNFSDDHQLGQGGFGIVYKGVLPDGQEIAVKRLLMNKGQGDVEFKNEILILAKLRHINLVKLLGFCLENKEMILIYEFVANRSLDHFIYDPLKRRSMSWETRYKIIVDIAKGILYLHENTRQKTIHRDLKAGNVLLDADFIPKIADFGMARLFKIDQTQTFASKVVGTLGYISPEYALQNQVSVKLDVYSYGVLILEIISGQKITSFFYQENQENLLSFAWRNWKENTSWNLVDPTILSNDSKLEILRCIHIGLLCVQHKAEDRPTMSTVDIMLSSNSVQLQEPAPPAFFAESNCLSNMASEWSYTTTDHQASIRSGRDSINGVSITELEPRS
ncbi:unnamed protein product [Amaranthus hypochondriacus]